MKLQQRSYSAKSFRPKPHIHQDHEGGHLIIATAWGESEHTVSLVEEMSRYLSAARSDVEVTTPFEYQPTLSDEANQARIAILIANETIYRAHNKNKYSMGLEVLILSQKGQQLTWAQVGAPHVLIQRQGRPLIPIAPSYDHAFESALSGEFLAPLPSRLIGVENHCHIHCGELMVQEHDQLVLLASSLLPSQIWTQEGFIDLPKISRILSEQMPEMPFWLGCVEL